MANKSLCAGTCTLRFKALNAAQRAKLSPLETWHLLAEPGSILPYTQNVARESEITV